MNNILLLTAFLAVSSDAQVIFRAQGTARDATAVYQENMARRQTADKLKRLCDAKEFVARSEKAKIGCGYAKAHADTEMALHLAMEWDANQRLNQAYMAGYTNPHIDRAVQYEKQAAEWRKRAREAGAVKVTDGLDSVGLEPGKDY